VATLREAEEALEKLHSWRLALRRAQQFRGRRARRPHRSSPHAYPAKRTPSEGDQRHEASRARVQSEPEAQASCARRVHNDEDETGENEGGREPRGAVQDSTEESYEPRPNSDAPACESRSRGAETEAKVAPAAQGWLLPQMATSGIVSRISGTSRSRPRRGQPAATVNRLRRTASPPMRAGVVQLIGCLSVKRAAPAKSPDASPPIETVREEARKVHWWRGNRSIGMAKFGQ
jgi:hypothetical protein